MNLTRVKSQSGEGLPKRECVVSSWVVKSDEDNEPERPWTLTFRVERAEHERFQVTKHAFLCWTLTILALFSGTPHTPFQVFSRDLFLHIPPSNCIEQRRLSKLQRRSVKTSEKEILTRSWVLQDTLDDGQENKRRSRRTLVSLF